MKKLLLTCAFVLLANSSYAAYTGPLETLPTSSVKEVMSAKDESKMCMEGRIVNKVATSKDEYTFEDASGVMVVAIDAQIFGTASVNEKTKVRLCGEVDYEMALDNEFDVKSMQVIK